MSSSSGGGAAGDDDAGGMVVVMLVAKITMAVVSMFVLQALTSPIVPLAADVDDGHCTLGRAAAVPVPELQPWRESLSVITDRFPRRPGVAEHERVAMVVKSMMINTKMEGEEETKNGKQEQEDDHVELLRTRSGELREVLHFNKTIEDYIRIMSSLARQSGMCIQIGTGQHVKTDFHLVAPGALEQQNGMDQYVH
uniref:Uncharacterized protein n=1 Tax=Oryza rufipogon TaxID=4529 RepID=A0A0E0R5B1_ORYRU